MSEGGRDGGREGQTKDRVKVREGGVERNSKVDVGVKRTHPSWQMLPVTRAHESN